MWFKLSIFGLSALSVVSASSSRAQSVSDEGFLRGRQFAELSVRGAFDGRTEDWSFYVYWTSLGSDRRAQFAVRRIDPQAGLSWADTKTCEPLTATIASMAALAPPSISIPGMYRATPPPPPVFDGVQYHLSFSYAAWGDDAAGELAFGGNYDSPVATWHERMSEDLSNCWKASLPSET
ncbi:hypothetical protein [Brevundimonas subvibrioides]|uniref:hypothetical protein n=1 Tax=Brevundimonas subvibrioides TaxID=74313 RepID=UPI0022B2BD4C|nr:hypothetical protein [Brevundimonas subvibrioides]